ncbi:MAG: hypothetical protein ACLQIQ_21960 [Beijerinckiaceae bacterium]
MKRCALGALLVLASPAAASAACLDVHNVAHVELRGTLTYRIFAGPPNFEDVRRGDTPEPDYILELDKPVCAEGNDSVDSATKVDRVQIYVAGQGKRPEHLQDDLAHLRGKRVVVKIASLDGATTAHHHAPLIAALRSIAAAGEEEAVPPGSQAVVKAFYQALSVGAGEEAARFVVPGKRRSGPLSADALSRFYAELEVRLELRGIESRSPEEHLVRYRYKAPGAPVCNGRAVVTTTLRRGAAYIAGIQALDGC